MKYYEVIYDNVRNFFKFLVLSDGVYYLVFFFFNNNVLSSYFFVIVKRREKGEKFNIINFRLIDF